MTQILRYLRSFDSFGEPVSINYKGDSSFKTSIGAFFSIVLKALVLTFALLSLLDLFAYKNPQIIQVSQTLNNF